MNMFIELCLKTKNIQENVEEKYLPHEKTFLYNIIFFKLCVFN